MSRAILVLYDSIYGSTREAAMLIAETLGAAGLVAEARSVDSAAGLEEADAIVLGAPLYYGSWRRRAREALARAAALRPERPIALFALGPLQREAEDFAACRADLGRLAKAVPGFEPLAAEVFGGRYEPGSLKLSHRLLAALPASPLHGLGPREAGDGEEIRAWARGLAGRFAEAGL